MEHRLLRPGILPVGVPPSSDWWVSQADCIAGICLSARLRRRSLSGHIQTGHSLPPGSPKRPLSVIRRPAMGSAFSDEPHESDRAKPHSAISTSPTHLLVITP